MGIREKALELAAELKRSPDFAELKRAKAAIDGIPELKRELEAFSEKQKALYSSGLSSAEVSSRVNQLDKKYAELSGVPEIDRYLKASKAFNQLLANALKEVGSAIEADMKR
jgi:cell fate (sporulation/competence/biofilm development) regulator YlbF (YheA/YmcA/DUF963 family)